MISDKKQRAHDIKMAQSLIMKQIEDNVMQKIHQGRDMSRELAALQSMQSDAICKHSVSF